MSELQRTPIVDKNGKQTTVNKRVDRAGVDNRVLSVPPPPASGAWHSPLREATPGVPRQWDTPAAIVLDNVKAPKGWTKHTDDESDDGPYMEDIYGARLAPDSTGTGWNATDRDGSDLGEYDTFRQALNALG